MFSIPRPQGGTTYLWKAQFTLFGEETMRKLTKEPPKSAAAKRKKPKQQELFRPPSAAPKKKKRTTKAGRTHAVTMDKHGHPNVIEIGPQGGKIVGYRNGKPIYLDAWKAKQTKKTK